MILSFNNYIIESVYGNKIKFDYNGDQIVISGYNASDTIRNAVKWLDDNGHEFRRDTYSESDMNDMISRADHGYDKSNFVKLNNGNYFRITKRTINRRIPFIKRHIIDFGIEESSLTINLLDVRDKSIVNKSDLSDELGGIFVRAAKDILSKATSPMSAAEVWDKAKDFIETKGSTPDISMSSKLGMYSDNSDVSDKKTNLLFTIVSKNPNKYWLISRLDELNDTIEDVAEVDVKQVDVAKNPFSKAICVIGRSGHGKTVTVEKILINENHEYTLINKSDMRNSLIVDYTVGVGNEPGDFLKMIINAYDNPTKLYTLVFDEAHDYISKIKDDFIQALGGRGIIRSVSASSNVLDRLLPKNVERLGNNRVVIPDNVGIILLTSKPVIILGNVDIAKRLDIVNIGRVSYDQIRSGTISTSKDILSYKMSDTDKQKYLPTEDDDEFEY